MKRFLRRQGDLLEDLSDTPEYYMEISTKELRVRLWAMFGFGAVCMFFLLFLVGLYYA